MKNLINLFILLIFTTVSLNVNAQSSKIHYIPPITHIGTSGADIKDHYMYISTASADDVKVTIEEIGGGTNTVIVRNDNPIEYEIGKTGPSQLIAIQGISPGQPLTGLKLNNKGYKITADCPIYVSVRTIETNQAGALVSKGANALGAHFRSGMFPMGNETINFRSPHFMNYISILATDNETKVKVTLPNANSGESTLLINGSKQLYNGPFEIDLNQYESYIIATTSSNTDPVIQICFNWWTNSIC